MRGIRRMCIASFEKSVPVLKKFQEDGELHSDANNEGYEAIRMQLITISIQSVIIGARQLKPKRNT